MSRERDLSRFDLEICDGESGRCDANLYPNNRGDWVTFLHAQSIIRDLEMEAEAVAKEVSRLENRIEELEDELRVAREEAE